jgi:hypothetical protein
MKYLILAIEFLIIVFISFNMFNFLIDRSKSFILYLLLYIFLIAFCFLSFPFVEKRLTFYNGLYMNYHAAIVVIIEYLIVLSTVIGSIFYRKKR